MTSDNNVDSSINNLTFQILEWRAGDAETDEGEVLYRISLYGKTKELKSVYLEINDFKPFFFVKIKSSWAKCYHNIISEIREKISMEFKDSLLEYKIIDAHDFYGFTGGKSSKFIKLTFKNIGGMRKYEYKFQQPIFYPYLRTKTSFKVYESNIPPFLRMMHIKDLRSVGWIAVPEQELEGFGSMPPTCNDINASINWKHIKKVDDNNIVKFSIASFDIECTSGDGSFPQPDRKTDKVIQIGVTVSRYSESECYYKHILCLKETAPVEGVTVQWFENEKDLLLEFPKLIQKLNPDIITGYNINGFDFDYLKRRSEFLGIEVKFSRLSRVNNELTPFVDRKLESAAIGQSVFKYYDMTGRVIIDLMKVVQRDYKLGSYKLDDVAANFIKDTILDISPDEDMKTKIKLKDTSKFDVDQLISFVYKNKTTKEEKKYKDDKKFKILKVGEEYLTIDGKINNDLFKDGYNMYLVQTNDKKHTIREYKLGNVIGDEIINIAKESENRLKLKTKNTYGLGVGQYIVLLYNDGIIENKYKDGMKFKILQLEKDSMSIEGAIEKDELVGKGYKLYWSQTKDDVGPQDIFRLQEGTPKDRAIVAKYCIQDCELCNKLVNKLQIINNNVSMANVCSVPFSFIFYRGQGIKILSLVSKKCREKNHLIPVLAKKKKKGPRTEEELRQEKLDAGLHQHINKINGKYDDVEEDEEDEVGYEGATVFNPVKGAYFEPVTVLDYASLYPNAMRLRNLSHECLVNDPNFDNLEDYKYHEITFNNSDGTTTTCRFAERKDGTKGIVPEILTDLLSARKRYKNLMEDEKDPFLKAILDSLQLAYKVTANSLYGQTGASTSAIFMKEIAASTTATGREALQFSKYFVENTFNEMVDLALTDKKKYMKKMHEIYKYYPTKIDVVDYVIIDDGSKSKKKKSLNKKPLKERIEYTIHVETEENKVIDPKKFIKSEIGYELDGDIYDEFKDFFDLIKCQKGDDPKENFTKNKFYLAIKSLPVSQRENFYKDLYDMIINTISRVPFYYKYIDVFNKIQLSFEEYILKFKQKLLELTKEKQLLFFRRLDDHIANMGYTTKEELFEKFYIIMNKILKGYSIKPEIIYGDTDSVFFCPRTKDVVTNKKLKGEAALRIGIELGIWSSIMICCLLPDPMAQEYEKNYDPFILISKKRYVGNLYEKNLKKFYQKSMGIVLKRRDNAPIVKIVCGGIVNQLLNKKSPEGALEFTQQSLKKIITGKYKIDKYVVTKTLRTDYKNRASIVHAVLADRMAARDPGNKPQSNDRIPYAYVEVKGKPKLQGDRVETPDFIIKNNLKLDFLFYITNQIMKPCLQFLELVIENPEKVFMEYIVKEENRKKGIAPLGYYANKDKEELSSDSSESEDDNIFEKIINDKNYKHVTKKVKKTRNLDCFKKKKEKKTKKVDPKILLDPKKYKNRANNFNDMCQNMYDDFEEDSVDSIKGTLKKKKIEKKKRHMKINDEKVEYNFSMKNYIGKSKETDLDDYKFKRIN